MTAPKAAEVEADGLLRWLGERHDEHMFRAGWVRAEKAPCGWVRVRDVDSDTHNEWVSKANEVFAIRAELASRFAAHPSKGE